MRRRPKARNRHDLYSKGETPSAAVEEQAEREKRLKAYVEQYEAKGKIRFRKRK
ncbi:MAG: hypothetical protein KAV00_06970 [Phycisphaerae bacterium]|nr:hypothetical protein [Phycisphaerae bacterium]